MIYKKKLTTGCRAGVLTLISAGLLMAHHSLARFDTTKAVRVKGTVVQVNQINPHSFIYLEEKSSDGQTIRWAVEGPSILQLTRQGYAKDFLKPGDIVEVCGYAPKDTTDSKSTSLAGRLLDAEVLVMPDGTQHNWGDYGFHKCFPPGYTDQHSPAR